MKSQKLCWIAVAFAFAFALGAGCGGNTERNVSDPDAGVVAYGGAAGVGGSAGAGGAGRAGATGSSGTSSGAAGIAGTIGGDAGSGGTTVGSGGNGSGGSAGEADAGTVDTCSLPADPGVCLAAFPRFFYDPVTASCREFTYGGCGGNLNNFMTLADCEAKCSHRANRCAMCLSDGCMDLYDCSACPVNGDAGGRVCATAGFLCHFGGCGGPICTCREGAPGLLGNASFFRARQPARRRAAAERVRRGLQRVATKA